MRKPSNWILEKLKDAGAKVTPPRTRIASHILTIDGVFCAADIVRSIPAIDRVSVYRTIELLASLDIVHPAVQLDGQQYYELHQEENHHHHVVCVGCRKSTCIDCSIPSVSAKGFSDVHHSFTMTGTCVSCTV